MKRPMLNRALTLEAKERAPDGAGGFVETWTPLGTLWCEVKAGTGREAGRDFATLSRVPYQIALRAMPYGAPSRPKPDQRFRDGARLFTILAVTDRDPEGRYLVCNAVEEEVS
ncbi:MAG: head-tail adaptor protein [Pseudomonadota bacterium]